MFTKLIINLRIPQRTDTKFGLLVSQNNTSFDIIMFYPRSNLILFIINYLEPNNSGITMVKTILLNCVNLFLIKSKQLRTYFLDFHSK